METAKTPKDIIFDFADMLAVSLGTPENPNYEKACSVLMTMTKLGEQNPVFIKKIFSEQFMSEIADLVPKFQSGKLGYLDLISVGANLKKTFDNA